MEPETHISAPDVGLEIDDDLTDIVPRRRARHPVMMLVIITFSGLLMWMYWDDLVYFTRPREPMDLGSTERFQEQYEANHNFDAGFPHNVYARITGLTGLRTTANDGQWTFLKMAYVPLYVQIGPEQSAGLDPDETLYLTVSGRLRRMAATSKYDALQAYYTRRFGVSFENAYILESGKKPQDFWWAPLLFGLFVFFALLNTFLLVRRLVRG